MRHDTEPDVFGQLLRHHRLGARLTQEELAERAGLAVRSIPGLEAGEHRPQRDTLRRLAEALGLTPGQRVRFEAASLRLADSRGAPGRADPPRDRHALRLLAAGRGEDDPPAEAHDPPHNLPAQLTSFIGRERELADVARLLGPPNGSAALRPRLVTFTGTGGCGKTRLALQVAARVLGDYPDGVWFADLAPLGDPALVPQTVLAALDTADLPGPAPLAALIDRLRSRHSLLILDNCEHLLDACAHLADALLRGCPNLSILATSREALGIAGEYSYQVPSLAAPDPDQLPPVASLLDYDAVRLFVERALAVRPEFALTVHNAAATAQVCRRLDGIPLAIELAAARMRAVPVEILSSRLEDRFRLLTGGSRTALPRQQTLRATVSWSYDLLTERERDLFDRLSVFSGGFTLEAAEAVCVGDGIKMLDVLDLLARLADQSLVVVDDADGDSNGRFRLLEILRQYGRERLTARAGSDAFQRRHAAYFLGLAEEAEPHVARLASLDRLGADLNNMRAALRWHVDQGAIEDGLRLAAALGELWSHLRLPGEGYAWLKTLLDAPTAETTGRTRAKAQGWAGAMALMVGDAIDGHALLEDSLSYGRTAQDDAIIGEAAMRLGLLTVSRGDYATSRQLFEECLTARQRSGTREQVIRSTYFLSLVMVWQGERVAATALLEPGLAEARAIGYRHGAAAILGVLGLIAMARGDQGAARSHWEESLQLFEEAMDWPEVSAVRNYLAGLDAREGHVAAARAGYAASLALTRPARFVVRIAQSLDGLAVLAAGQGQFERALRLAGASAALRDAAGYRAPPNERKELERVLAVARHALGDAAASLAWTTGQAMGLDQAVEEALEPLANA